MAKKKHRKQPEKTKQVIPEITQEQPAHQPIQRNSFRAILILVALLTIGTASYFLLIKKNSNQSLQVIHQELSRINFSGTEPQVVEKIRNLQKEVQQNPKSSASWGKLAMNLDIHDFKKESIPCYKQAAVLDPNDFRWPYYTAIVLDEMGSPEALSFYEQSIAQKPDYSATHLRYADSLFQAKRFEEASKEFNLTLNTDKSSSNAYVGLARIALTTGNLDSARSNLEKAVQANPKHGEVHGLLSEVYRRLNLQEDSNRELQLSQQLPKKKPLQDKLELELIGEGVSSYWYELRGRAYLDQGYYEDAIKELKLAVQYSPSDSRLLSTLGAAYLQSRNYDEAAQQLQASLALNPNSVNAMNNLATAFFEMGKTDEAILWLKKAIQKEPSFAGSYDHLGRMLLRSGKRPEAFQTYQQARQQFPEDSTLALQLAWILATSSDDNLRDAEKAFQLADGVCKTKNYGDPECLYVLAAAYADAGQFDGAIKLAQRAIQISIKSGQSQLVVQIQNHLKSYEASKPIRE